MTGNLFFFIPIILTFAALSAFWNDYLTSQLITTQRIYSKSRWLAHGLSFTCIYAFFGATSILSSIYPNPGNLNISAITSLAVFILFCFTRWPRVALKEAFAAKRNAPNYITSFLRNIKKSKKSLLLSICILVIIVCLLYRSLLPLSHGDTFSQYLFDSIQLLNLENLGILKAYDLGIFFRTDSTAAFFDTFIIKSTGIITVVIYIRLFALILILGIGIEFLSAIINQDNSDNIVLTPNIFLFFIAIILTMPDIWDIAASGKIDIYVCLLEITCARLLLLNHKKFIAIATLISVIAVFTRLSSIALAIICFLCCIYACMKDYHRNRIDELSLSTLIKKALLYVSILLALIIIFGFIGFLNLTHANNPFWFLSPPNSISHLFDDAKYIHNYEVFKQDYNLNLSHNLFGLGSIFYTVFAIEPLRFIMIRLSEFNILNIPFINYALDWASPALPHLLVSIVALPVVIIVVYIQRLEWINRHFYGIVLLTGWLLIWTAGITYTRTIMACGFLLAAYGVSTYYQKAYINHEGYRLDSFYRQRLFLVTMRFIKAYSYFLIIIFTAWCIHSTYDNFPRLQTYILSFRNSNQQNFLVMDYYKIVSKDYKKANEETQIMQDFLLKYENALKTIPKDVTPLMTTRHHSGLILRYMISRGIVISGPLELTEVAELSAKHKVICFEFIPEGNDSFKENLHCQGQDK